ncbi:hypothetical protein FRC02_001837 [Tulasnella sp. 418]|nr:hypothetical protein FRC02_001837 [Tulasnella sp. 418]
MSLSINLPQQYGLVALSTASYFWLSFWQSVNVGKHRRRANIPYPLAYADKAQQDASKEAFQFNCAQRAHANTLETLPMIIIMTLFTGLSYPVFAASTGFAWTIARVLFTLSYTIAGPGKRNSWGGAFAHIIFAVQGVAMSWCATKMAIGW